MLDGKHYSRAEQSILSFPRPPRWSRLNDVFSIHFSVVILIAGKFRCTVNVVQGCNAAATGVTYAKRKSAPLNDPTPAAYCRHHNRSDYRTHVGKVCFSFVIITRFN